MQRRSAGGTAPRQGASFTLRALRSLFLAAGSALLLLATVSSPPAAAKPPTAGVQLTLTAWIDGVQSAKPIFWGTVLEYHLEMANTTGGPTNAFTVVVPIPRDGIYAANTATCGSVPNCSVVEQTGKHDNLIFSVSSLPTGGDGVATFDVVLRVGAQFQTIAEVAHLFGDSCSAAPCSSNKAVNHVLPRPVALLGFPAYGLPAPTGTNILYILQIKNPSRNDQPDVTISDNIPAGTTYVAGSASCLKTPGCTASGSDGGVNYHIAVVPVHPGKKYKVQFEARVNATSGMIVNTAGWTGDLCSIGPCATNTVQQPVGPATTGSTTGSGGGGGGSGVTVTKSADASQVQPGQKLTYTLAVANGSNTSQSNMVLKDSVPSGSTYVPGSATCGHVTGCTANEANGSVTWTISSVAANATGLDLGFAVTVGSASSGALTNVATWTGGGCSAGGTCTSNQVVTPVGPATAPGGGSGSGAGSGPVGGATQAHTGLPWAGSKRFVLIAVGLGLVLLGSGLLWRQIVAARRRSAHPAD